MDKSTNIKERILQIADYKKISKEKFFESIGMTYGNFKGKSKQTPINSNAIVEILTIYPDINIEWLMTGRGEIIVNDDKKAEEVNIITPSNEVFLHKNGSSQVPKVVTVDNSGKENIVLVPVKAAAGYLNGFGDPEFIQSLPTYSIPNIQNGVFRMFQVNGHSMYPTLHSGAYVVGQFVENWIKDIKDDRVFILVSKNEGIVIKRCLNRISKYGTIYCKSDNRREYPSFAMAPSEILEVWEFKMALTWELSNPADIYERINDLEAKVNFLESRSK
ncbi:S24 family peptidase [Flavobacterium kingsejongi]|uniref:Uncharacterized protein n=1 Tax=Flavobacterium kingsejongi TaxID=1678728 RepID=A0A2S1LTU7_9FLAO|nr:S24/S26 family peptidase [Flavobacterium kingsejongi]AWG27185.1 hypothetical protein FK004_19170 [Flavobacterium kingsejongi]